MADFVKLLANVINELDHVQLIYLATQHCTYLRTWICIYIHTYIVCKHLCMHTFCINFFKHSLSSSSHSLPTVMATPTHTHTHSLQWIINAPQRNYSETHLLHLMTHFLHLQLLNTMTVQRYTRELEKGLVLITATQHVHAHQNATIYKVHLI